jgi:hypothetical protein
MFAAGCMACELCGYRADETRVALDLHRSAVRVRPHPLLGSDRTAPPQALAQATPAADLFSNPRSRRPPCLGCWKPAARTEAGCAVARESRRWKANPEAVHSLSPGALLPAQNAPGSRNNAAARAGRTPGTPLDRSASTAACMGALATVPVRTDCRSLCWCRHLNAGIQRNSHVSWRLGRRPLRMTSPPVLHRRC